MNDNIETKENTTQKMSDDALKEAINEQMSKLRGQSMALGFRVGCKTILDKIAAFERKPGSKSNNDHKRLIKDIKQFCEQALVNKTKKDEETKPVDNTDAQTTQN